MLILQYINDPNYFSCAVGSPLRYPPSLVRECHRCALLPIDVPVPTCFDSLFRRPFYSGQHQPSSDLTLATHFEGLVQRKVTRKLSATDLEEKQEVKDGNIQQRCEEDNEGKLETLEEGKGTSGGLRLTARGG